MTSAITLEKRSSVNAKQILAAVLCCILIMSVCMMANSTIAYCSNTTGNNTNTNATTAASTAIETAIEDMANQIYKTLRSIITPITIIGFAWAGFQFLLGGSQGTEKARKIIMGAGIGLALVVFAPLFGQAIATWFAASGTGNLSNYNPL